VGEGREIAADVQREAVHRNPMAHADANRRDFAGWPGHFRVLDPNSGEAGPPRGGDFKLG